MMIMYNETQFIPIQYLKMKLITILLVTRNNYIYRTSIFKLSSSVIITEVKRTYGSGYIIRVLGYWLYLN